MTNLLGLRIFQTLVGLVVFQHRNDGVENSRSHLVVADQVVKEAKIFVELAAKVVGYVLNIVECVIVIELLIVFSC